MSLSAFSCIPFHCRWVPTIKHSFIFDRHIWGRVVTVMGTWVTGVSIQEETRPLFTKQGFSVWNNVRFNYRGLAEGNRPRRGCRGLPPRGAPGLCRCAGELRAAPQDRGPVAGPRPLGPPGLRAARVPQRAATLSRIIPG